MYVKSLDNKIPWKQGDSVYTYAPHGDTRKKCVCSMYVCMYVCMHVCMCVRLWYMHAYALETCVYANDSDPQHYTEYIQDIQL